MTASLQSDGLHGARKFRAQIDLAATTPLRRIWRYIGYDEPNYSYTVAGRELLAKLGSLADAPYYVRTHFLLCSGDGKGRPKWGSTNVLTVDQAGRLRFDWEIWDRIFDAHLDSGCIPFVELGFMPQALSSAPQATRYDDERQGGWRFPPRDYGPWGELIAEVARHSLSRYGSRAVSQWYWELWNEPDIFYWAGIPEEYFKLFDVTEAALHSVLPFARLGGPATTNPATEGGARFLRAFLEHCTSGTNAVTGETGARLDFVTFHAKGGRFTRDSQASKSTPTVATLLDNVRAGLAIVGDFAKLRHAEIVLSECDPDGWAAGSASDNPNLDYRNREYYASYFASAALSLLNLADARGPRVDGMLTWAFEFEGRGYFEGLRTLSTNGIDKPILNAFRLFSLLGGRRAALRIEPGAAPSGPISAAAAPRVISAAQEEAAAATALKGIATVDSAGTARLLLVHHDDDWDVTLPAEVTIELRGLRSGARVRVEELILDHDHANSYTAWKAMGSPQSPTVEERGRLLDAQRLHREERTVDCSGGSCTLALRMRSHAVHLLTVMPQ